MSFECTIRYLDCMGMGVWVGETCITLHMNLNLFRVSVAWYEDFIAMCSNGFPCSESWELLTVS